MADRDEHPRDVRHAGLTGNGEIAALVGDGHLGRRVNSASRVSLAFAQRFAFAAVRALRSTMVALFGAVVGFTRQGCVE
jgi:hypothetical protein